MKTTPTPRAFRSLSILVIALAAFGISPPAAQAQSYLDTEGDIAGFQATNGGTYTLSGSFWNPDSSGIGTLAAFTAGSGITIGSAANEFDGMSFSININNSNAFGGIAVNSANTTVTLTGAGNNSPAGTWTVAVGSTLNQSNTYDANSMNWQGAAVTLAGGGTINFNKMIGYNSGGKITEDDVGAGLKVNLKAAAIGTSYSGGYTLTSGTLNFATAASANAFQGFTNASKPFAINGGTLDNTSGSPITLTVGSTGYSIGGNFIFTGSGNLDFGTAPVKLTATPQITVAANHLTVGGIISGSGYGLTKAGPGMLTLNGVNTYDGDTIISEGSLGGSGTISGATTFEPGAKAVFTVTPGGSVGNNSTLMTITGTMTFNATEVHLNLPDNMPGGVFTLAISGTTPVANGAFPTPVVDSGSFDSKVTAATITLNTLTNQLILTAASTFTGPVKLAVTQVNGGADPIAGAAFDVVVEAQNGSSITTHVLANTAVTLSLNTGTGTLNEPLSGTILKGQNKVIFSGVTYTKAESGVVLTATRTSGDSLTPGASMPFTVNPAAVSGAHSTVTASPGVVTANGIAPATITVTLRDAYDNPVLGRTVTLASSRDTADMISEPSGDSDGNGVVTFTVTSSTFGVADFSATDTTDGVPLAQTATVAFTTLLVGEQQVTPGNYDTTPAPINVVGNDLLQTNFSSATGELAPPRMRDGTIVGDPYADSPIVMTYALDTTSNPAGYDIKEIRMFTGAYAGRAGQSYDVLYSLVGDTETFILLGTVLTPPTEYGAIMTRTYDSTAGSTPDAGPAILTGVAQIRFNIRPLPNTNGAVWREIDVTGTATGAGSGATYADWADANGVTGGSNGDSDNDGNSNLIEYALLLDPTGFDGSPGDFNGRLLSFTKRGEAVTNGDVTYAIETSPNLQPPWSSVVTHAPGNTDATISYTLPTGQGKVFARLKVRTP
jgi:autotransporter-associated beta strand protein